MSCPSSPDPDGYHRYQLVSHSGEADYETTCVHCGLERTERPSQPIVRWGGRDHAARQREGTAKRAVVARAPVTIVPSVTLDVLPDGQLPPAPQDA